MKLNLVKQHQKVRVFSEINSNNFCCALEEFYCILFSIMKRIPHRERIGPML